MTKRLYYSDSYLREFEAAVVDVRPDPARVYLDRTAFYPASGGQPADSGLLGGAQVVDVVDEEDRIAHILEGPVPSGAVRGYLDWGRRFDHMQQHSGQHLLSATLHEVLGIATLSFHLGSEASTIDIEAPALEATQAAEIELAANRFVCENRPIAISFEDSGADLHLRKPSERTGPLRIISIEGLDRSACGGTHVRSTGEIGPILIRKLDKMRGNVRVEFVCGLRAVRRARADLDTLSRIARGFSAPLDETPELVEAKSARLAEADKQRRKLVIELARRRGRELYEATQPGSRGLRLYEARGTAAIDDETRTEAQAFVAGPAAAYLAASASPPSLLLAVSDDAPLKAGETMKTLLARHGGRGGGNATIAQGSLPSAEALDRAVEELGALLR